MSSLCFSFSLSLTSVAGPTETLLYSSHLSPSLPIILRTFEKNYELLPPSLHQLQQVPQVGFLDVHEHHRDHQDVPRWPHDVIMAFWHERRTLGLHLQRKQSKTESRTKCPLSGVRVIFRLSKWSVKQSLIINFVLLRRNVQFLHSPVSSQDRFLHNFSISILFNYH